MGNKFSFAYLCKTLAEINKIYKLGDNISFGLSQTHFKYTYYTIEKEKLIYIPFKFNDVPIVTRLNMYQC